MNMDGIHISPFALFTILIFQAGLIAASVQTFSGITEVVIETQNYSLSDDFIFNIGTSLEALLSGSVDDITIIPHGSLAAEKITISFLGYFENFAAIPICFQNETFYYKSDILNATYSFKSILMQNFPNDFEDQCTENGKNVAYIVYIKDMEEECQFESMECESNHNLNRSYRFELIENLPVLFSFFCANVTGEEGIRNVCTNSSDWLQLQWQKTNTTSPTCLVDDRVFSVFKPDLDLIDDSKLNKHVRLENVPISLSCLITSVTNTYELPTILIHGDQTWEKLPDWIKLCLRVLHGLSLVALLFCLLTFAMFRELRNIHGKNVLSLVIAGMLYLFYSSGYIPLYTDNRKLCVFIATLMYYSVLVPNYWWTAVAIFLAWTLGRKGIHRMDEDSGSRFFLLLSLFGWGIPLLFSLLAVFLHIGGIKVFNIDEYCWIIKGWPTYLITVQTFIPFLMDCVLFVLVVYRLRATRLEMASMNSGRKRQRNERQLTIKMAAIFGVLWLPSWIIYVAFLFKPINSLAMVAQLLNQLSTFILPIVLCCNRRVVGLWKVTLAPLRDRITSFTHSTTVSKTHSSQYDPVRGTEPRLDANEIQLQKQHFK